MLLVSYKNVTIGFVLHSTAVYSTFYVEREFMSADNQDFNIIAQECGLNTGNCANTNILIDKLKDIHSEQEIIPIYNYMLSISTEPDVIMHLIQNLDMYRHPSTLEFLVDILLLKNAKNSDSQTKEKYNNVRIMCAKAIANQKNTDVVSSLLYCLNNKDENYRVRLACADALGKIGDRFAVAPLIDVVKDENEKSVYLRETAAFALGLLGDSRAIDPLVGILETKQGIMYKFSFLKERAIEALNKMGFGSNERVFKALKNSLMDESPQVRINAIEAMMDSEHPKAFETIKKCLTEDSDEEVKKNALVALYNMSDRKILDEVINGEYSNDLKKEAANIIEEYEE